jgi:hypothetical protein
MTTHDDMVAAWKEEVWHTRDELARDSEVLPPRSASARRGRCLGRGQLLYASAARVFFISFLC